MDTILLFKISNISFCLLFILYIFLTRLHFKKVAQRQQKEAELLQTISSHVNRNILNLINLKNNTTDLRSRITKENKKSNYLSQIEAIKHKITEFLHLNDDTDFLNFVNLQLGNFGTRLMEQYPKITIKNLKYLILLMLDIPNHEIKEILGYTDSSFPTIKTRIAHKLELQSISSLNKFLYDFIRE